MSLSEIAHPGSPGIYRRISATQDLLFNDVNSLTSRINQELQQQQQKKQSSTNHNSQGGTTESRNCGKGKHSLPSGQSVDECEVSDNTNGESNNQNSHGSSCSSSCNHTSSSSGAKESSKKEGGSRRGSSTLKLSALMNHEILRRAFSSNHEKDSSGGASHSRKNSCRKGSKECPSPPSPLSKQCTGSCASASALASQHQFQSSGSGFGSVGGQTATPDYCFGLSSNQQHHCASSRLHLHQSPESIRGTTLAAKMASEVQQQQGWPNSKDDYELGEVIGQYSSAITHKPSFSSQTRRHRFVYFL